MSPDEAEYARRHITELITAHAEWFITQADGHTESLRRNELDLAVSQGRLVLSSWTEKGTRSWRVLAWEWTGAKLLLRGARRMGRERPVLELIPRASATAVAATVRAARQIRCYELAQLASSLQAGAKIERTALSPGMRRGQPGRYARIILRLTRERIAVTATVVGAYASNVDAFLSSALLWFARTSERARAPYIQRLWLVLESGAVKPTLERIALLRDGLKEVISVYKIDEAWQTVTAVTVPERQCLWKKRLARFPPVTAPETSDWTKAAVAHAPEAIDVVQSRHGETLRYFGLPFARVRRLMGTERVWFGIAGARARVLDEDAAPDWANLLRDLGEHRAPDASDHHHALYRNASESWLESLLRRNITKLDPGLIIAPLHAQFRTPRAGRLGVRPIDLLALRQDGQLVVIELKVSADRELVLQGVDYWRRVEAHRRRGHITRAKIFGELRIREEAPLVYLVAPTLRFHRSFQTLALAIAPDIEIYRFDINENWRSGVRVMRRTRVN